LDVEALWSVVLNDLLLEEPMELAPEWVWLLAPELAHLGRSNSLKFKDFKWRQVRLKGRALKFCRTCHI
jgi:hypothetical protein